MLQSILQREASLGCKKLQMKGNRTLFLRAANSCRLATLRQLEVMKYMHIVMICNLAVVSKNETLPLFIS